MDFARSNCVNKNKQVVSVGPISDAIRVLSENRPAPEAPKEKPKYAVGVSVLLINSAGQVLLAKRKNCDGAGMLSTPGGRLEREEDLCECAAREFNEECLADLVPEDLEIIGWREHFRFGHHYFMFYVRATRFVGEICNGIPDKSEDWRWYDIDTLTGQNCTEPKGILDLLKAGDPVLRDGQVWDGRGFPRDLNKERGR